MVDADKALKLILDECVALATEKVKLRNSLHRSLVGDIIAKENIPPFDNSSMDGFALNSSSIRKASKTNPIELKLVGESSAGNLFNAKVKSGETVRIMTGGKVPDGADCVVPLELISTDEKTVRFVSPAKPGAHIRRAGEDIKLKDAALESGEVVGPAHLAVLASLGFTKVEVTRKPVVRILPTGNELVDISKKLSGGQIRNSSSYALAGFVKETGGKSVVLPIAPDKKKRIRKAISAALGSDVLIITGGVSVGKYDLVKEVLEELQVEIKFWRVNIKPGRPLLFGKYKKTLVFGLPGNPASTSVTFLQFVRPALEKMLGRNPVPSFHLSAILDEPIVKKDGKRHFVRGIVTSVKGALHVRTTGTQSSGVMSSMAKANCLIILPEKSSSAKKCSRVEIEMITEIR